MAQANTVPLGAAILFVCISAAWRQNEQVFSEVIYVNGIYPLRYI